MSAPARWSSSSPGIRLWFVEMNSRLDMAHPVTEAILGLDLVGMQLAVAEGRPLPVEARHCSPSGHAIGVRLCASDPAAGYPPGAGRLRRFEIDPAPGCGSRPAWSPGPTVGGDDDAALATIVAFAATRAEAVRRLVAALEAVRVHGPRTNRDELIAALRHPEFAAGAVDAGFLDRHHGRAGRSPGRRRGAAPPRRGRHPGRPDPSSGEVGPGDLHRPRRGTGGGRLPDGRGRGRDRRGRQRRGTTRPPDRQRHGRSSRPRGGRTPPPGGRRPGRRRHRLRQPPRPHASSSCGRSATRRRTPAQARCLRDGHRPCC